MIFSERFGLIFIHIPKTAGSSISAALSKSDPEALRSLGGLRKTKHVTASELRSFYDEFDDFFSFAVVRDPYTRFCSLYRYLHTVPKYTKLIRDIGSLEAFAELFEAPSWVDALHSAKPQSDFVTDNSGAVIVTSIYRYEALDRAATLLSSRLGRRLVLPYKKVTRKGVEPRIRTGAHILQLLLPYKSARRETVEPRIPSVERILQKRFYRDYQLFGY